MNGDSVKDVTENTDIMMCDAPCKFIQRLNHKQKINQEAIMKRLDAMDKKQEKMIEEQNGVIKEHGIDIKKLSAFMIKKETENGFTKEKMDDLKDGQKNLDGRLDKAASKKEMDEKVDDIKTMVKELKSLFITERDARIEKEEEKESEKKEEKSKIKQIVLNNGLVFICGIITTIIAIIAGNILGV